MDNQSLARVLQDIADALEIKGEGFFRIRSYRLSAESVGSHGEDVAEMIRRGDDLGSITGVGGGIAAKLRELVETGRCQYHEELLSEIPRSLLDLLKVPGLGPKGVSLVFRELGVRSAEDLEAAIADGRFRTLPGMKERKEARIRQGLEARRAAAKRSATS
jgi:DNA polymerase (family 10)